MEFKPCPCGKVPKKLIIESLGYSFSKCAGDCCQDWWVEFRDRHYPHGNDDLVTNAIHAWNDAPREIAIKDCFTGYRKMILTVDAIIELAKYAGIEIGVSANLNELEATTEIRIIQSTDEKGKRYTQFRR